MWWKVYFYVLAFVTVFGFLVVLGSFPWTVLDIVGAVSGLTLPLAVYSYLFKKKIFDQQIWKYIWWFQIFYICLILLLSIDVAQGTIFDMLKSETELTGPNAIYDLLFYIPAYITLMRLANNKNVPVVKVKIKNKRKHKK